LTSFSEAEGSKGTIGSVDIEEEEVGVIMEVFEEGSDLRRKEAEGDRSVLLVMIL
jgi:hypothetical protein